jgi:nucleotide-binding universal stress UspA family protein
MTNAEEAPMFSRLLIPLDGSEVAERVLPYSRFLATRLNLPPELLTVIDITDVASRIPAEKTPFFADFLEKFRQRSKEYLKVKANTFEGVPSNCIVEQGAPAETIIEKAAADRGTLINMATHGYSGIKRWLLGSVAEKVLRGATNPLLLVRAREGARTDAEADLRSVIVALDGSELAERVLPVVADLAKRLPLHVILFRAYSLPASALAVEPEAAYLVSDEKLIAGLRDQAVDYLQKKAEAIKQNGVENVSVVAEYGLAADEIIALAKKTPQNLIAMCTHGYSGARRWVLGSVTETVVRHSEHPVLVIRAE